MNCKTFPIAILFCAALNILPICNADFQNDLYCFECLNTDCPSESPECQKIREAVQSELENLYHFWSVTLLPCPNLTETFDWKMLEEDTDPCLERDREKSKCSLGRLQVQTKETGANGKITVKYTHATVMGCANSNLLDRLQKAKNLEKDCDTFTSNHTEDDEKNIEHNINVRHCVQNSSQCDTDFCIDWRDSKVEQWPVAERKSLLDSYYAKRFVILLITLCVTIAFVVGIACAYLRKKVISWILRQRQISHMEENGDILGGTVSYKKLLSTDQYTEYI